MPIALPPTLGALWQVVLAKHPGSRNSIATGVIPILTRLTIESYDQPIRLDRPIDIRAGFELAHAKERGEVARLFMNVWSDVRGMAGRMGLPQRDADYAPAGRLFAEHTFTRLFAPPDQRKVTRLDVEGYPAIPEASYEMPAPATAHEAPDGATWLDELSVDPTDIAFTLDQTDANQHVNSLVYIRVFIDAAQRRLAARGLSLELRSSAVDIAYRKPSFAGDRVQAHLRLYDRAGAPGVAGMITGSDGKPRCYVRVQFTP
jgi:catechol 2,3-dioxygenase-like lactoylglutathione lyase family enzyme